MTPKKRLISFMIFLPSLAVLILHRAFVVGNLNIRDKLVFCIFFMVWIVYYVFFVSDFFYIQNFLNDLLKLSTNAVRKKNKYLFLTAQAKEIREVLFCLERKIFSLMKENSKIENEDFNNPINFLKRVSIDGEISKEEFFKNILNLLSTFFNKNALVIFYFDKEKNTSFSISSLSSNKHLSSFIKQNFLNTIINKKEVQEGIVNYYSVENILEDLSFFGYKNAIVKRIKDEENNNLYIYLWVGFCENKIPLSKELNSVQDIVLEIERQFETYLKLKKASSELKIKTKEAVEKSEYLEFVSHDLRSPLANLVTILKLLEINSSQEVKKEFIEIALNNCDSISVLLEDLLDFSKYKHSGLVAYKEVFKVDDEILKIIKDSNLRAVQKNLKLSYSNSAKDTFINSDKRQFKKIINNIVSNAIKYTNVGFIKVECEAIDDECVIKIEDSGVGIPENILNDIFTSFKRGENVESFEGYGIGLFMVNIFSSLNNIALDVESKEGKGSIFTLKIKKVENSFLDSDYKVGEGVKKILLLDDDKALLLSTEKLLRVKGYEVVSFESVEKIKKYLLDKNVADLILSDYLIGNEKVDDLLKILKANKILIDVVIVSGKNDIDKNFYIRNGVTAILPKPFSLDFFNEK